MKDLQRQAPSLVSRAFVLLALVGCTTGETDELAGETARGQPGPVESSTVVPVPELAESPLADPAPLETGRSTALGPVATAPVTPTPYETELEPKIRRGGRTVQMGYVMEANLRWPGEVKQPQLQGLSREELKQAAIDLSRQLSVELEAGGTLKLTIAGGALPLPRETTLLADAEHYGHLLLWPDRKQYRVLPPGSLLAVMREHRPDVAPLVSAKVERGKAGNERRFGLALTKVRLETERGTISMENVELPEAGTAAPLLCRLLLDFLAVAPTAETCDSTQVPVRATFETPHGEIEFAASSLRPVADGVASPMSPPRTARFVTRGLPPLQDSFLRKSAWQALVGDASEAATGRLEVVNGSELGAYLLWQGTPISYLPPRTGRTFEEVRKGTHELELRGIFGDVILERRRVEVDDEGRFALVEPTLDAGTTE